MPVKEISNGGKPIEDSICPCWEEEQIEGVHDPSPTWGIVRNFRFKQESWAKGKRYT